MILLQPFIKALTIFLFLVLYLPVNCQTQPPFSGTIFIDPDIVTASDPSAFQDITYSGKEDRTVFDRRVNKFITINAYLYQITFDDGLTCEAQVNPEFESDDAASQARKYAWLVGQLPKALRVDVVKIWIHKGDQLFGGW